MSEKTYRAWRPDQVWLLPPSPRDWLSEGHLVYFLMDAVRELDISAITSYYERELRGFPPFHPRMMLTLLIFCYATGTRSSRKIMPRCEQDVACRVIVGEDVPDFHAISEFRRRHIAAFEKLFVEVLKLASASPLLKVGRLALDGTKIKANASRHKAMSYERMQAEEVRLQNEIRELLAQAEAEDQAEDAQQGANRRGDELPDELQHRESRLKKIREAKAALGEAARAKAAAENAEQNLAREAAGKEPKPSNLDEVKPDPKAQYNFTDPDSRVMMSSNKGWDQCGNAQALVDESQLVVAAKVAQQANDVQQVAPLLDTLEDNFAAADITDRPQDFVADAGDDSDSNANDVRSRDMTPYIATQRLKHHEELPHPEMAQPHAAYGPHAANQTGLQDLPEAKRTNRTRPVLQKTNAGANQTSDRLPPILHARTSENERRMATRLPDPQPPQTLASRPDLIPTTTPRSCPKCQSELTEIRYEDKLLVVGQLEIAG